MQADRYAVTSYGRRRLEGVNTTTGPDSLIGDIALFSPDRKRTLKVVCETGCELDTMSHEQIALMSCQNPKRGFYFMRSVAVQLLADVQRPEASAQGS